MNAQQLLQEISDYCRQAGLAESTFGRRAVNDGKLTARLDMTRQERDFRFRVRANDAVDPPREGAWHRVTVSQPPRLASLFPDRRSASENGAVPKSTAA